MPTLRPEHAADRPAIRAVNEAAFPTPAEAKLVNALRDAGHLTLSLVAVVDDQVVGHVAFSPMDAPTTPGGLGLGPLAVLPDFQRRGVGAALVNAGLNYCREHDIGFVALLGDPRYYGRFGFVPAATHGLTNEFGHESAFQVIELRPGSLPPPGTCLRYAPAFRALGDEA